MLLAEINDILYKYDWDPLKNYNHEEVQEQQYYLATKYIEYDKNKAFFEKRSNYRRDKLPF